jgi:Rod binding domain-containing protein
MDVESMRITNNSQSKLAQINKAKAMARGNGVDEAKIDEVSKEFEAQFISQMLENMFSTIDTNPVLGGGEGEDMYKSLLVNEYGKLISRAGGVGVADHVKREMIRMQEVE